MQSVCISETALTASRVVKEAVRPFEALCDHPFRLPVSRVLEYERSRRLGSHRVIVRYGQHVQPEQSHRAHSIYSGLALSSSAPARSTGSLVPALTLRTKSQRPSCRHFTTKCPRRAPDPAVSSTARKLPPRPAARSKAPPPSSLLARKPLPSRNTPSDDDFAFGTIISTSAEELHQRQKRFEKALVIDKAHQAWLFQWRIVEEKWKRYLAIPRISKASIKAELHKAWQVGLAELRQSIDDLSSVLTGFHTHTQARLKEARKLGRQDQIHHGLIAAQKKAWERHYDVHWKPIVQRLDQFASQCESLQWQVSEIRYTIAWKAWRAEQLDLQATESLQQLAEMKASGGDHFLNINALRDAGSDIETLRDHLQSVMTLTQRRQDIVMQIQLQRSLSGFSSFMDTVSALGHHWRMLNRLAQVGLRLPQATQHKAVAVIADNIMSSYRQNAEYMVDAASHLAFLAEKRGARQSRRARCDALITHLKQARSRSALKFRSELRLALCDGLLLSNPALPSSFGLRMCKALQPIHRYLMTMEDVDSELGVLARGNDPYFRHSTSQTTFTSIHDIINHESRWFFYQINEFEIYFSVSSLKNESPPLEMKWPEAYRSDPQQLQAQTISQFSHFKYRHDQLESVYCSPMAPLYPSSKSVAVDYVISREHAEQVLNQLLSYKLLGVELLMRKSTQRSSAVRYVLVAAIDRVTIFEFQALLGPAHKPFEALMTSRKILKIFSDLQASRLITESKLIVPQNFVILGENEHASRTMPRTQRQRPSAEGPSKNLVTVIDEISGITRQGLPRSSPSKREIVTFPDTSHFVALAESRGMLRVLREISLLPMINLITFLGAFTFNVLKDLPHELRQSISEASQSLDATLRESGMRHSVPHHLSLGPIRWDRDANAEAVEGPHGLMRKLDPGNGAPHNLTTFVETLASLELTKLSLQNKASIILTSQELKNPSTRKCLAAYYLYTSFGTDLSAISILLNNVAPSADICWIVKQLDLPLSARHQKELQPASDKPDSVSYSESVQRLKDEYTVYWNNLVSLSHEAALIIMASGKTLQSRVAYHRDKSWILVQNYPLTSHRSERLRILQSAYLARTNQLSRTSHVVIQFITARKRSVNTVMRRCGPRNDFEVVYMGTTEKKTLPGFVKTTSHDKFIVRTATTNDRGVSTKPSDNIVSSNARDRPRLLKQATKSLKVKPASSETSSKSLALSTENPTLPDIFKPRKDLERRANVSVPNLRTRAYAKARAVEAGDSHFDQAASNNTARGARYLIDQGARRVPSRPVARRTKSIPQARKEP